MGYEPIKEEFKDVVCVDCLDLFDVVSTTGPINICKRCLKERADAIFSGDIPAEHFFPVPGFEVTCGSRKPPMTHDFVELGIDVRHFDDGVLAEAKVFACINCGRDKMKDPRPRKPKAPVPPPMDPTVKKHRDALRKQLFELGITGDERTRALAQFDSITEGQLCRM